MTRTSTFGMKNRAAAAVSVALLAASLGLAAIGYFGQVEGAMIFAASPVFLSLLLHQIFHGWSMLAPNSGVSAGAKRLWLALAIGSGAALSAAFGATVTVLVAGLDGVAAIVPVLGFNGVGAACLLGAMVVRSSAAIDQRLYGGRT